MKIANRFTALGWKEAPRGHVLQMMDACPSVMPAPQQAETVGFAVIGQDDLRLNTENEKVWIGSYQVCKKSVPASVLEEEVQRLEDKIKADEKRTIGKKERKKLKEQALLNLLPKAFVVVRAFPVLFMPRAGLVLVGSTAEKDVELVAATLNSGASKCKLEPVSLKGNYLDAATLGTGMAELVMGESDVEGLEKFEVGTSVALVGESKEQIAVKGMDVDCDEVASHITSYGRRVKKVALIFGEDIAFNLAVGRGEVVVDGLKLLGITETNGKKEGSGDEAPVARYVTAYTLLASSVAVMTRALVQAFPAGMDDGESAKAA